MINFPKDFPDKLRSAILVSEVVGKKVKLKLRGKEFQGLCPFHNEQTPSFTVNDQKGFYHCFGCQAHGDIVGFIMNSEGLDFPSAVNKLADDFGIPIPQVRFDVAKENAIEREYFLLEKIAQFFEKNLFIDFTKTAISYLQKRAISLATIKKFRLGFALDSFEALTNFLKAENFTDEEIAKTGVIGKSEKNRLYDKFRNRVIFPIADKKNRIIAFGGRSIGEDLPKYLNSSETEFFKKNQTLYNFYFARKAIFDKGYVVVVEGYMDVISLAQSGIENVVAGLGTALSSEHLKGLFQITDKIVICLDGDFAGIRAAKRVSEFALPLISAKKNLFFAFLPNQMDPDDFVKKFGTLALEKIFTEANSLSESLFKFALMECKIDKMTKISAENKAKLEVNLNQKIEAITDFSSKKYFSLFFREQLFLLGKNSGNFSKKLTYSAFENQGIFARKTYIQAVDNVADCLAKNILALMIKFPQLTKFYTEEISAEKIIFVSENLTNLKETLIEVVANNPKITEKSLIELLEKHEFSGEVAELKKILPRLTDDFHFGSTQFHILLLKDLLFHIEQQYKEALSQIDEIETHQSAITDQKIKEIFSYKNSIEQKILLLEKEIN